MLGIPSLQQYHTICDARTELWISLLKLYIYVCKGGFGEEQLVSLGHISHRGQKQWKTKFLVLLVQECIEQF